VSTSDIVYPYAVLGGVTLVVSNFVEATNGESLTGVLRREEGETAGQVRFDLIDAKPSWTGLQFDVSFELSQESASTVLPDPSVLRQDTVGIVSVRCASTKYRHGVRLQPRGEYGWRGTVEFARDDVLGVVELTPLVARTADIQGDRPHGFAAFGGALLADGPPVQLVLDRSARRFDGSMEYKWENFASSDNPWLKARKDDVFHVEPADVPILYLNLRWGFLKPILDFEGRTGEGAAMRDMAAAAIAQGAWTELFMMALASIRDDGDEYSVGGEAWRRDLVRIVLNELYADQPESDRLRLAYEEWRDPSSVALIISKVGAVAQSRSTIGKLMEKAVKQVEALAASSSEIR
jgi:hypothetical protein